jgi:hypothetical protein
MGEIHPVAVFEAVHQGAGDLVIANGGPRLAVGGWIGDRLHREDAGTRVVGERRSQTLAVGWRDEREPRPTDGAQPAVLAQRLAARRAERRQADVEHGTERTAQRGGKARASRARARGYGALIHAVKASAAPRFAKALPSSRKPLQAAIRNL